MQRKVERHYDPADWDRISYHLKQNGYILLGEHYCPSPDTFKKRIASWGVRAIFYSFDRLSTDKIGDFFFQPEEYSDSKKIPIHQEFSYTLEAPRYLFFYCRSPAQIGGETTILDGVRLLDEFPKNILNDFLTKGFTYHRNMPYRGGLGETWPVHFESNNRPEIEAYLSKKNIQFQWNEDDSLSTSRTQKATRFHPDLQKEVWFAQPLLWHVSALGEQGNFFTQRFPSSQFPSHVTYGTGEEIPAEHLEKLRLWKQENAMYLQWNPRDLLVIDNWRVAHGRETFAGPREHWIAMGSPSK